MTGCWPAQLVQLSAAPARRHLLRRCSPPLALPTFVPRPGGHQTRWAGAMHDTARLPPHARAGCGCPLHPPACCARQPDTRAPLQGASDTPYLDPAVGSFVSDVTHSRPDGHSQDGHRQGSAGARYSCAGSWPVHHAFAQSAPPGWLPWSGGPRAPAKPPGLSFCTRCLRCRSWWPPWPADSSTAPTSVCRLASPSPVPASIRAFSPELPSAEGWGTLPDEELNSGATSSTQSPPTTPLNLDGSPGVWLSGTVQRLPMAAAVLPARACSLL